MFGVGNQNGDDSLCGNVYMDSLTSFTTYSTVTNSLYTMPTPTLEPTPTPTPMPTHTPTEPPTAVPRPRPTLAPTMSSAPTRLVEGGVGTLFAITTASVCAESLSYGPYGMSSWWESSSAFFCVDCDMSSHHTWMQLRLRRDLRTPKKSSPSV